MDTRNRTQIPPPPQVQQQPADRDRGGGVVIVMLLGLLVWGVGFALAATAVDAEEPMTNYTMAIGCGIVGATFLILAALYDIAGRNR